MVRGEVISERHDACCACTALATGHRHLGRESATRQGTRTCCNAIFAMGDGWMLGMNSWNHENLKKQNDKTQPCKNWLKYAKKWEFT